MTTEKKLDSITDHWKLNPDANWLIIPSRDGSNLARRHAQYLPELLDKVREAVVEEEAEGFYIQKRPDDG